MKPINDYIVERIRVDNIKPQFPINGTLNDIIEFLESNGFAKMEYWNNSLVFNQFDAINARVFILWELSGYSPHLWFADTSNGKISKDNPVFLIIPENKTSTKHKFACSDTDLRNSISQREFANDLNERFRWRI